MPADLYAPIDQVAEALGIVGSKAEDLDDLERAIQAASRQVDEYCHRRFWVDTEDRTGWFVGRGHPLLLLGPIPELAEVASVTSVDVDRAGDGTFSTPLTVDVDFYLAPRSSRHGAYPRLRMFRGGWAAGVEVRVVGRFGVDGAPSDVVQATAMQAARLFKRTTEAPMGSAMVSMADGQPFMRPSRYLDGDVEQLLRPHVLDPVAVA